jgi:hypothetical protein
MTVNILISSRDIGEAIAEIIKLIFHNVDINIILLNNPYILSNNILKSELWITDIWNPEDPTNPEGFRTIMKIISKARSLLIFYTFFPSELPIEGPFWISLLSDKPLSDKIIEVLNTPPPSKADLKNLINIWPLLGEEPALNYHHNRRK